MCFVAIELYRVRALCRHLGSMESESKEEWRLEEEGPPSEGGFQGPGELGKLSDVSLGLKQPVGVTESTLLLGLGWGKP